MELSEVIIKPWVSEKAHSSTNERKYTFMVDRRANKLQIKDAVEKYFKVTVLAVNTYQARGREGTSWTKMRRIHGHGPKFKKAVVTLAEGNSIPELSEST
jgi:large subunit ribosomal protein L23